MGLARSRLLRVTAPNFVAGAVLTDKGEKAWWCTDCAPILRWMRGRSAAYIKEGLEKRGLKWEWVDETKFQEIADRSET
jgi:hypothetical protein